MLLRWILRSLRSEASVDCKKPAHATVCTATQQVFDLAFVNVVFVIQTLRVFVNLAFLNSNTEYIFLIAFHKTDVSLH